VINGKPPYNNRHYHTRHKTDKRKPGKVYQSPQLLTLTFRNVHRGSHEGDGAPPQTALWNLWLRLCYSQSIVYRRSLIVTQSSCRLNMLTLLRYSSWLTHTVILKLPIDLTVGLPGEQRHKPLYPTESSAAALGFKAICKCQILMYNWTNASQVSDRISLHLAHYDVHFMKC